MEVALPQEGLNRKTMYDFLHTIIDGHGEPRASDIELHFTNIGFVEPVGVTVLSNLTEWLIHKGVKLKYVYPTPTTTGFTQSEPLKYLDDSLYFARYLGGKPLRKYSRVRDTTVPLQVISVAESFQWFERVKNWLAPKIHVTTQSLGDLSMCLQEVFNNIRDHSTKQIGSTFIQHYPRTSTVSIAISDFGVGIPHNIRLREPSLNDAECLLKAIEAKFSTKSTPQNRGVGLDTLIYNTVVNNGGSVYIHSNYGILDCTEGFDGVEKRTRLTDIFYPGTLIQINLRTDTIENIPSDDEEEFEW